MKKQVLNMVIVLLVAGAAQAADTPPPIPVAPKDAKTLVGVPRPPSDNVMGRTEQFNAQAKVGGFDVLFIGDSITHCWESEHGKEVWAKRIAPFKAANFGIGGDTTQTVIWRLDNGNLTGALDPKVIVLMLGTNNSCFDKPEEVAAGIGAILARLHERFPKAKILLYAIFARNDANNNQRQGNDAANKIIAKYDGYWNIKYIDFNPKLTKPDGNLLDGVMFDGTHPTAKGYEIWADSLVPELQEVLKK
jgi:lysophospholipase L1-like esterase